MAKSNKKKIGILGGSFDPPHKGHLKISQIAIDKLSLDDMVWYQNVDSQLELHLYFD